MSYNFKMIEHYSCCGINHLCSFDSYGELEYDSLVDALSQMGGNRLAEITLTDQQMAEMPDLVCDMATAGFVLVCRFRNSNSGNVVNVFHHVPTREPLGDAPRWTHRVRTEAGVAGTVEEASPPASPTVVHSTFHNVYPRSGRSGCGWPSLEVAQAHRGRAVSVDRCDIYSDGTMTWTQEN